MAYKDPEKQKEANRKAAENARLRKKGMTENSHTQEEEGMTQENHTQKDMTDVSHTRVIPEESVTVLQGQVAALSTMLKTEVRTLNAMILSLQRKVDGMAGQKEETIPQYNFEDHEQRILMIEALARGDIPELPVNQTKRLYNTVTNPGSYKLPDITHQMFPKTGKDPRKPIYTKEERESKLRR